MKTRRRRCSAAQCLSLRSTLVDHDGHSPNGLAAPAPIIREGISDSLPHFAVAGDLSGPLVDILFVLLKPDPYLHTKHCLRADFHSTLRPTPRQEEGPAASLVPRLYTQTSLQEIKFQECEQAPDGGAIRNEPGVASGG
jgi:hypothetical protein